MRGIGAFCTVMHYGIEAIEYGFNVLQMFQALDLLDCQRFCACPL